MAIQTFKHGVPLPVWPPLVVGPPSLSVLEFGISTTGHKVARVAHATAAKNIRYVYIRTSIVNTGDNLDVRIETVGTDGNPTGTLWATNTNVTLTVANGDDSVWLKAGPLTADATLAVGDIFAIVASLNGSGDMFFASYDDAESIRSPYGLIYTGSYAKQPRSPMFFAEYSDGSYEPVLGVLDVGGPINTYTFTSASTTNRRGNRYDLPFPCRTNGCWVWRGLGDTGDFTMKLYDTDGTTVLATTGTIDDDWARAVAAGLQFLPWTTPVSLSATGPYRLSFEPGATDHVTYDFDIPDADMMNQFPLGTALYRSVYTSGAWVDTTTARSYMGLFLDGFADDLGAGGGSYDVVQRVIGSGLIG